MTETQPGAIIWNSGHWRPVPGLPGLEVSYAGRARWSKDGRESKMIRNHRIGPCGSYNIRVPEAARIDHKVGELVALAWIGPVPPGMVLRYKDGNPLNHHASNLAYGTPAEFAADQQARAERERALGAPTHCPAGHEYAPRWIGGFGEQVCNKCLRAAKIKPGSHPCQECGIVMQGVLRTQKYCDPCRTRLRRESGRAREYKPRNYTCTQCNQVKTTENRGRLPAKCPDCKAIRQPKPPRVANCSKCAEDFPVTRGGTLPKYCDDCRPEKPTGGIGVRHTSCRDCREEIVTRKPGPLPILCTACRSEATRKKGRKAPRMLTCEWCNAQEPVMRGKVPAVCSTCRPEWHKQKNREAQVRLKERKAATEQYERLRRS